LIRPGVGAKANIVWRFYTTKDHQWKWQQVTVRLEVIAQSSTSFEDYESCLANANDNGYVRRVFQLKIALRFH
jgi:hypothetical protein